MAYLQARAGIARSGVTHTGWTPPNVVCKIAGTDRTGSILNTAESPWAITLRADGTPSTFQFVTKDFTPTVGQAVTITYATPTDYLFTGVILQRQATPISPSSAALHWVCTAIDDRWLMDRYDRVLESYLSRGVGSIVADILARFTDGGFRVGYCPSSLGTLTIELTRETVSGAIERIARAVGAVWRVTNRVVDVYVTYPEAALATVTQAEILAGSFTYQDDLTQVRTRAVFAGRGSTTTSAVAAGASTIPVADLSPFSASGGDIVSGTVEATYTGVAPTGDGSGTLTGCTGITHDLASGVEVSIFVDQTDAAAAAALATTLGGGLSGQATNTLQDGRLSISEATARATGDVSVFGGALTDVTFTYGRPVRHLTAGRTLTLAVTAPLSLSGNHTVQSITITRRGAMGGVNIEVNQRVQFGQFSRTITDLLRQLRG